MNIREYTELLEGKINNELAKYQSQDLTTISRSLVVLYQVIADLKAFVRQYKFISVEEEISFFKTIKPVFVSQLEYYTVLFQVTVHRSHNKEPDTKFYDKYLNRFERYIKKNKDFFQYCMSGSTHNDRLYFTRKVSTIPSIDKDEMFTTVYDTKLGKFLGNQLARDYILSITKKESDQKLSNAPLLEWTESKVSLVELAYALFASRGFENGNASIKQIIGMFEQTTGLDLSNYARIFADIRLRKTGPTNFLDRLSRHYTQYIESIES